MYTFYRHPDMHQHRSGSACLRIITILILCTLLLSGIAAAATQSVTVQRIADDGKTILLERTVDYRWMEQNLPVIGDGTTHIYLQGPVFEGDRWDPKESVNVETKDNGAVRGTAVTELAKLVGGIPPESSVKIISADGWNKVFSSDYIISPESRMGPMFLAWEKDGKDVSRGYSDGMRLLWWPDTSINEWGYHVFGVADMKATLKEEEWYFYNDQYPTTTGISAQNVAKIQILTEEEIVTEKEIQTFPIIVSGTINGSIVATRSDAEPKTLVSTSEVTVSLPVPANSVRGLVSVMYTDGKTGLSSSSSPITVTVPGSGTATRQYFDPTTRPAKQIGMDVFEVTSPAPGTLQITVAKDTDPKIDRVVVTGVSGIFWCEDASLPERHYWIAEGNDRLDPDIDREEQITRAEITGNLAGNQALTNATLTLIAANLGNDRKTQTFLRIGEEEFPNAVTGEKDRITIGTVSLDDLTLRLPQTIEFGSMGSGSSTTPMENHYIIVQAEVVSSLPEPATTPVPEATYRENVTLSPAVTPLPDDTIPEKISSGSGELSLIDQILSFLRNLIGLEPLPLETSRTPVIAPTVPTPAPTQVTVKTTLTVRSDPAEALISLNGTYTGKVTPYTFTDLAPGTYTITLTRTGLLPYEEQITLTGKQTIAATLTPESHGTSLLYYGKPLDDKEYTRAAGFYVTSSPSSQDILLNGKVINQKTPDIIAGFREGTYTIGIDPASRLLTTESSVFVPEDIILPVTFDGSNPGTQELSFGSRTYDGMPYTVNGKSYRGTLPEIRESEIVRYLNIRTPDAYLSFARTQIPDLNSIQPQNQNMHDLAVTSDPEGAAILIDGWTTGYHTPYTITNLSDGFHTVAISLPGYLPDQKELYLAPTSGGTEVSFKQASYETGLLEIDSNVPGSKVYIYGRNTGKTTPVIISGLPIGTISVKVTAPNGESKTHDQIVIIPKVTTKATFNFEGH